jgi:hypothetical protein
METPLLETFQKFSGRIMGKGKFAKFLEASMTPGNGNLAEDQHGQEDTRSIQKEVGERAHPERNKGLIDLIHDGDGKGDETDKNITRSRPLTEMGVQSQEKKDSEEPVQGDMKQAEGI